MRARVGTSSWIDRDPNEPGISKSLRRNIIYFRKMATATPAWVDHDRIVAVYNESKRQRNLGWAVCVDHVVPLNHKYVCGLHCHDNLQGITERDNERKSNYYWPDMWHEQFELFNNLECEQYELPLPLLN